MSTFLTPNFGCFAPNPRPREESRGRQEYVSRRQAPISEQAQFILALREFLGLPLREDRFLTGGSRAGSGQKAEAQAGMKRLPRRRPLPGSEFR